MKFIAEIIKYLSILLVIISFTYLIFRFITDIRKLLNSEDNLSSSMYIEKKKSRSILKLIIPAFLINRCIIFVTTYLFHIYFTEERRLFFNSFNEIWNKWDSPHYLSIAQYGYQNVNDERFFIVFYPLYPALIRLVNIFINDYFFSGILLSNLLFIIGLYFLYRLVEMDFNDSDTPISTVKYALIFPFSFFFSIAYTESLFFTLCIMTFYFARKRKWNISCFIGMLAALTRNQGVLLTVPIAIEMLYEQELLISLKKGKLHSFTALIWKRIISLMLIPAGTFLYLLINKIITGNWFKFLEYQKEHWYQSFGFFASNLRNHFINIFKMDAKLILGIWVPQIILFFIAILILIYNTNKIRLSYIAFSFVYIIISYSPTWLLSGPRYLCGMFTLFLMFSNLSVKVKNIRLFVDYGMLLLLIFYSIEFYLGNVY